MKKPGMMQILFFLMIPFGVIVLIFSIRMVQKTFSGKIILDLPYLQQTGDFVLTEPGSFAVWHKGQYFTRAPLDEFRPVITCKSTGRQIALAPSFFRPNSNNGRTARMELFRFTAPAGEYKLELKEGTGVSAVENTIISKIPVRKVDFDEYFIQVRESQPRYIAFFGIVLIALSGSSIVFGLVMGILAKQLFHS